MTRERVAVTTQEPLDGLREKAMRIASLDQMEATCAARRGPSPGGPDIDKTQQAKEIVRVLVGSTTTGWDIVVACDNKSKLWRDAALNRSNAKLEQ